MARARVVDVSVEDTGDGRVVVRRYSDGAVEREPVVKKKPTRRPRLRRQTLKRKVRTTQAKP